MMVPELSKVLDDLRGIEKEYELIIEADSKAPTDPSEESLTLMLYNLRRFNEAVLLLSEKEANPFEGQQS